MTPTARVVPLPTGSPTADPVSVDLTALTRWELQVVFYAAGLRWSLGIDTSTDTLAQIVVEQIHRLGLPTVQEIALQVHDAVTHCKCATWEHLLPGDEARSDAHFYAVLFLRRLRAATHQTTAAITTWQRLRPATTTPGVAA